jgi:arylsulfatase A-like enzyme
MHPPSWIAPLAVLLLAANCPAQVPAPEKPRLPNIVLIVADDLGYGELGCYGGKDVPTPHLDSIASNGVRAESGYVTCPVCAPTRAALLTGCYQQRFGLEWNPGNARQAPADYGLPEDQPTLAERLAAAGYATGMVGKWHLGYRQGTRPTERGFQEFFGFLAGAHGYRPAATRSEQEGAEPRPAAAPANAAEAAPNPILRGTEPVTESEWLTAAFAREGVAFVDRHREHPFFLYLPFNAVHAPLDAPPALRARFPDLRGRRRTFAAMLAGLDEAVGAVLAKLDACKLTDDTLVVFLSDNGGPTPSTTSGNGPLRGTKGQVWEGGVRVPMLLRWPGRLPAGATVRAPIASIDLAATILAAAGVKADQLDGQDLVPFLSGASTTLPRSELCWRFGPQRAIRQGNWKLVAIDGRVPQLFDLERDVGERRDLAAAEPATVERLLAAWQAWDAQNRAPRWPRR